MEEYKGKEDGYYYEQIYRSEVGVSCSVNDHSEVSDTNISSKENENKTSLNTENKISEPHDDLKMNDQLGHAHFSTSESLTTGVQENISESNALKEVLPNDQVGFSIESELENIHRDIYNIENDKLSGKLESLIENNEKMDWTDNVQESDIQLTKESLETQTGKTLQEVLEEKDDSQSNILNKSLGNKHEEKMDIIESSFISSISKTLERSELVTDLEQNDKVETLENKSSTEEVENMDTTLDNIENSIFYESIDKDKVSDMESKVTSQENESISKGNQSISLNQSIDSGSILMETPSVSLDSSIGSQPIPFIEPICIEESRLSEKQPESVETHVDSQSIPLENQPTSLEGESVSLKKSVESQPVPSEKQPVSKGISSENKAPSSDQSVSSDVQPITADSQSVPIPVESQSTPLENEPEIQPISDDSQLMGAETQSITSLDQSMSLGNQSSSSLETQSTSTDSPSIFIGTISRKRHGSPISEDRSSMLSAESHSITVVDHSLSSLSSETQSTSSGSQSIPIEIRPTSVESSTESTAGESTDSASEKLVKSANASTATSSLEQDKEKTSDSQRENTEFVQVNTEKESEDNEKDDESNNRTLMEHDPIGSDSFEPMNEDREGADAELCIIPDTEREISQAEKDAASVIPPLRDISEASASVQSENNLAMTTSDQSSTSSVIIFKYEKEDLQICNECKLKRKVKYYYSSNNMTRYICDDNCLKVFKTTQEDRVAFNWEEGSLRVKDFSATSKEPPSLSFIRKCASCKKVTNDIENNLTWEIMDFCNEFCLSKYQKEIGSHCSSCQGEVKSNSLGKYCVRFGNDIRQFCTSVCLEKYKKGLKVCSYCQQDMSGGPQGFLAPVGDKGQFKDFCSQVCMEKYDIMTNDRPPKVSPGTICSVCKAEKPITIEFELDCSPNYFCSEPCFVAFSFVNNISPGKCAMCRRHFAKTVLEKHTMYYDNVQHSFCSNSCENIYIIAHRKIVPCSWCKVKKYNFDMIRRYSKTGPMINMCSVNCLSLYRVSVNAVNSRKTVCNFCLKLMHPLYHLTMSDATLRNFCSYNCVMGFQNQFPKQPITLNNLGDSGFPVPTGAPKKNKKHPGAPETVSSVSEASPLPIISSVQSLASTNGNITGAPPSLTPINTRSTRSKTTATNAPQILNSTPQIINSFADLPVQVQIKQHFIVRPAPMPDQRNVGTMCYTRKANKSTSMKPIMVDEGIQTDEREASKILIPIPVPIYVPTPMHMFSIPTPTPVPFPVPVPVPILIPTTRNSAAGIMKEIKKIQVKIPTDPYEAELLMMAEMVAEEKKEEVTDSESDVDDAGGPEDSYSPEHVEANTFGDDMLQMALKMATELDEPAVDLEGALTANTITAPQGGETHHAQEENVDDPQPMHSHMLERAPSTRGRKRGMRQSRGGSAKRGRRISHQQVDMPMMQHHQVQQAPPPPEPTEKPDANMCLKYTFGVNAWKQWVTTKNTELEKTSTQPMLFKTEILQLTADELNYSLCLFVKEVRKPNGAEYAPDTIYYLCLGIQQYLFENGRIDNIFCDVYYEKFTDCLDEVAKKFSVLYNDSHYIVTRVEEEHLWESKQLGAHSPHVLLSTLMFFNTKHFNLTTVDEHMQLSFSHIMKHWKRNPNQPVASKMPGLRNVLLRFYPPQSAIQNNTRKKKVYEQEQNEENPLRCPVKLYEFYLSKCPESVKTRNDVFYLQPERSCVPDSPVWYSTMPLPREALEKMLHRVKMVKEINVALLTS